MWGSLKKFWASYGPFVLAIVGGIAYGLAYWLDNRTGVPVDKIAFLKEVGKVLATAGIVAMYFRSEQFNEIFKEKFKQVMQDDAYVGVVVAKQKEGLVSGFQTILSTLPDSVGSLVRSHTESHLSLVKGEITSIRESLRFDKEKFGEGRNLYAYCRNVVLGRVLEKFPSHLIRELKPLLDRHLDRLLEPVYYEDYTIRIVMDSYDRDQDVLTYTVSRTFSVISESGQEVEIRSTSKMREPHKLDAGTKRAYLAFYVENDLLEPSTRTVDTEFEKDYSYRLMANGKTRVKIEAYRSTVLAEDRIYAQEFLRTTHFREVEFYPGNSGITIDMDLAHHIASGNPAGFATYVLKHTSFFLPGQDLVITFVS